MDLSPTIPSEFVPVVEEAVRDLCSVGVSIPDVAGIRFRFNVRMKPWGRYVHFGRTILISDANVMGGTAPVRNTVAHELIHAAYPYAGHGREFKRCAALVNAAFPGKYSISRLTSYGSVLTLEQAVEFYPYVTYCGKCGKFWGHRRMTRSVYDCNLFRCHCGGEILRRK